MLTVASYNIRSCRGWDGRTDPARVATLIGRLGADLVGLQEVATALSRHGEQLGRLAVGSGYPFSLPGPTLLHPQRDSGTALLSRYPARRVRHIDLSVRGREPRGALCADIDVDGLPVAAVVVHLGLRRRERRQQFDKLFAELDLPPGGLLVLLGDVNEWWPCDRRLGELDRRFGARQRPATFPSLLPLLALDRVWVSAGKVPLTVAVEAVSASPARIASDHLPLRAVIAGGKRLRHTDQAAALESGFKNSAKEI